MRSYPLLAITALGVLGLATAIPRAEAAVSINIGVAPACPYGYYDVPPYSCAPAGYYGPEWFNGGVFIGAGPWFHGPSDFRGHVDNHYHPDHGYRGPVPHPGEKADPARRVDSAHFAGNEMRDGRGHVAEERR
jgi:hypothetical protein